jgi:hypothetical protein
VFSSIERRTDPNPELSNPNRTTPNHPNLIEIKGEFFRTMARDESLIKQVEKDPNLGGKFGSKPEPEPNPNSGKWTTGQSGNPAGRPTGARQKISERLLTDLAEVWEQHGKTVLVRLAVNEPGKLASIAYGLLPRDVFVSVQAQPAAIDPEQWELLVGIARTMKEVAPDASLPEIEDALRSAFAKPVLDSK